MSLFDKIKNVFKTENIDNKNQSMNNIQFDFIKDLPFKVKIVNEIDGYSEEEMYKYSKRIIDNIKNNSKDLYDCIIDGILFQNECWERKINDNREKIKESIVIKEVEIYFEDNLNGFYRGIHVYTQPIQYLLPPDMEDKEENCGYMRAYFNNEEFKKGTSTSEWDW